MRRSKATTVPRWIQYDGRMKHVVMALLVAAAAACGDDDGSTGTDAGASGDASPGDDAGDADESDAAPDTEPAALEGILAAHNQVRADHGQAPLTWDGDLAALAQGWAEQCVDEQDPAGLIDNNPDRNDGFDDLVVENVFGSTDETTGPAAVATWASQEENYDYQADECDGSCGAYTQLVWDTTTRVGCGVHDCAELGFGYTIVCNYTPAGNTGGRPY